MTWTQRRNLKKSLIKCSIDFLAPNLKVYNLMQHLSSSPVVFESTGRIATSFVSNLKEVLQIRLYRLVSSNKLRLDDDFRDRIFLCFSGDKGGSTTKCCVSIGNVKDPNSVDNLILAGLYEGDDKAADLRSAFSTTIFEQLKNIKKITFEVDGQMTTKSVEWFVTGDMKFLCALYGHLGANATNPCLFCEADLSGYKVVSLFPRRTLQSITAAAMDFKERNNINLRPQERTKLNRNCKSVTMLPALDIALANVIPSSLHIIQGLGQDLIKILEEVAAEVGGQELLRNLEVVYKGLGADRQAWFQKFTGNHLRKLLTNEGPAKMTEVVAGSPFAPHLLQLFQMLGGMQGYAKASFLSDADIVKFEQLAHEYYDVFRVNFTLQSITSKAHWLVVHVPQFMKRWKFWGLMSEQPIEAMLHQVNKDSDRFASMRDPKKIRMKILEQSSLRNALFDNEISTDLIPDEEDVRMTLQQIE